MSPVRRWRVTVEVAPGLTQTEEVRAPEERVAKACALYVISDRLRQDAATYRVLRAVEVALNG